MRKMSFFLTEDKILSGVKTVTRRFGWWFLKEGDLILPVLKVMGLKKGEKLVYLRDAPLRICSVREERLEDITAQECALEGFPELTPLEFIEMLAMHYKKSFEYLRNQRVNRIQFTYL